MKKILPINKNPIIKCYQYNAFAISIASLHENFREWIIDNYIQLSFDYCNINRNGILVDFLGGTIFDSLSLLKYEDGNKDRYYSSGDKILSYIINKINEEKYICTMLNEYYVPERKNYKNEYFEHDIMIYGYNTDEKVINIIGYNNDGKYVASNISFCEFVKAFETNNLFLKLIEINKNKYDYNIFKFKDFLVDYIKGTDCKNKLDKYVDVSKGELSFFVGKYTNHTKVSFGIKIYDALKYYLMFVTSNDTEMDYRPFYTLYEHKVLMLERLNIVNVLEKKNIDKVILEYQNILEKSRIILNLIIKYQFKHEKEYIDQICKMLQEIKEQEICSLTEIITVFN